MRPCWPASSAWAAPCPTPHAPVKPGRLDALPGLVVTLSTTGDGAGGPTANLANLFQIVSVSRQADGSAAVWATWIQRQARVRHRRRHRPRRLPGAGRRARQGSRRPGGSRCRVQPDQRPLPPSRPQAGALAIPGLAPWRPRVLRKCSGSRDRGRLQTAGGITFSCRRRFPPGRLPHGWSPPVPDRAARVPDGQAQTARPRAAANLAGLKASGSNSPPTHSSIDWCSG